MKEQYILILLICLVYTQEPIEFTMHKTNTSLSNYKSMRSFSILPKGVNSFNVVGASLLELTQLREGLYTIRLSLGSPAKEFEVIVDTGSFLLWIPSEECKNCLNSNKLDISNSSLHKTNNKVKIGYITGKVEGHLAHDKLILGSLNVPKFRFLLTDIVDAPVPVDGILGLSRKYVKYDYSYSLIDSLYKQGKIKKKMFSQKISEDDESKFYLGEFAAEIAQNMNDYSFCQAINNNIKVETYWTCTLKKVLVSKKTGDKIINTNENEQNILLELTKTDSPAIFDTGANAILAPPYLYEHFRDYYFKELIEQKLCSLLEDYRDNTGFRCNDDIDFDILPKLYFVFDNNYTYEIHPKYLFVNNWNGKLFRIIFSNVPGNGWLLGTPFLKQYHMVFNHDDDTIGFYKDKGFTKIHSFRVQSIEGEYSFFSKYLYCLVSTILGLSLIIAILLIFYLKKKNLNKKFDFENITGDIRKSMLSSLNANNSF